ncbi:MAG: hypothetical protein IPF38_16235 [Burkholderiales bacterium]|nr:hypothetical protein [Burkholderiales bacterium]MBL0245911.1 hypothetical protein [Rhodoferax sp.]
MHYSTSSSLKWAYILVVLSSVIPIGLAKSGWVGMATGGSVFGGVPFVGPVLFLVMGLYRVVSIVRGTGTLDSHKISGLALVLRKAGIVGIYFGAVVAVLNLVAGPLMKMFMTHKTESGAEFFIVGVYLALAGGLGVLGLVAFEFSRLLGFEATARNGTLKPSFEPTAPADSAAEIKR